MTEDLHAILKDSRTAFLKYSAGEGGEVRIEVYNYRKEFSRIKSIWRDFRQITAAEFIIS